MAGRCDRARRLGRRRAPGKPSAPAAGRPGAPTPLPLAAAPASPSSPQHLLQDRLVQAQIRHELLEAVLVPQLPQLPTGGGYLSQAGGQSGHILNRLLRIVRPSLPLREALDRDENQFENESQTGSEKRETRPPSCTSLRSRTPSPDVRGARARWAGPRLRVHVSAVPSCSRTCLSSGGSHLRRRAAGRGEGHGGDQGRGPSGRSPRRRWCP